jgi:4-hydroxyproline epimerase
MSELQKIEVIDSHTGGEATRLIVAGGPALGEGSLHQRLQRFRDEFDHFRNAVVGEPRGSDVMVGALDCAPSDPSCAGAVIFFNNVGFLGMCGHGMMGYVVSLAYQGKITTGRHRIETPVGIVATELHADGGVTVHNVPAFRFGRQVKLHVPTVGDVVGDVAWGGNWFFLIGEHKQEIDLKNTEALSAFCWQVRQQLAADNVTGPAGEVIDHIELFAAPKNSNNHSRNFVLCPGKAYDRSPCGTGTSAKLACLANDGQLEPGEVWRQESILGSVFEGSFIWAEESPADGQERSIIPSIKGFAYVNGKATLLIKPDDPLRWGF